MVLVPWPWLPSDDPVARLFPRSNHSALNVRPPPDHRLARLAFAVLPHNRPLLYRNRRPVGPAAQLSRRPQTIRALGHQRQSDVPIYLNFLQTDFNLLVLPKEVRKGQEKYFSSILHFSLPRIDTLERNSSYILRLRIVDPINMRR